MATAIVESTAKQHSSLQVKSRKKALAAHLPNDASAELTGPSASVTTVVEEMAIVSPNTTKRRISRAKLSRATAPERLIPSELATSAAPTFSNPVLEQDFIAYCQMSSALLTPDGKLSRKRMELLEAAQDHRFLEEFDMPGAAEAICGETLLEPLATDAEVEQWKESQGMFASLCAARLLSIPEEKSVMRRLHYLKYLACQLLSAESIDQWTIARSQALLRAANWHRDVIVQANVRLVVSIVKKMPVPVEMHDELISEGIVALLRAVDKFDPNRGYRLCTYATPIIRRECYHYLEDVKSEQRQFSRSLSVLTAAADVSAGDRAHWIAWRKRLLGLIKNLSRREQVIIRSRYCLGAHRQVKTLQRLADALKISKERVRQLEHSALAKLRTWAEAQGR